MSVEAATQTVAMVLDQAELGTCSMQVRRNIGMLWCVRAL